jgi:predicted outer membrane repeat protein
MFGGLLAAAAGLVMLPATAGAVVKYPVTYVAGVGGVDYGSASDSNNCSQETTPCATLDTALAYTSAGGTVYVSGTVSETIAAYAYTGVTIAANPDGTSAAISGVSPNDTDGLLVVNGAVSVTLRGLTLENGYNNVSGGAVVNHSGGTLTIDHSSFIDNSAASNAGAIANGDLSSSSATLIITDSTFRGNSTVNGVGGAIDNADEGGNSTVTVAGSTFTGNSAGASGGAIANGLDGGNGALTITDSTFTDNVGSVHFPDPTTESSGGGAIASGGMSGTGTLTVAGSSFSGNRAVTGGAIDSGDYGGTGSLVVTGTSFGGNQATWAGLSGGGGAIMSGGGRGGGSVAGVGTASIDASSFSANTAAGDGGAVDSGDFGGAGTLSVSDSTFTGNSATHDGGGAIDSGSYKGTGRLTISGSSFGGNSAGIDGGAVDSADQGSGIATVSESTFVDNTAPGNQGGAIDNADYAGSGNLTVVQSTFSGNSDSNGATIEDTAWGGGTGSVYLAADLIAGSCIDGGATGTWVDAGFNAATTAGCLGSPAAPTDAPVSAAAGDLGSLANNGGSTRTMELLLGNPAIGLIPHGTAVTVSDGATKPVISCPLSADQRGDASLSSGGCDAGAVQYQAQTLSFSSSAPAGATAGGATYTPTAISSSGLPPVFSVDPSTTNSACAVSGGVVHFDAAGICVIDATEAGNANFAPAPVVKQTISVAAAPAGPAKQVLPRVQILGKSSRVSAARVGVRLSCAQADCAGVVTLERRITLVVRHGRKRVHLHRLAVLGSVGYSLKAGATGNFQVALNKLGRQELTAAKGRRLTVTVVASAPPGEPASLSERLSLSKGKRRRH